MKIDINYWLQQLSNPTTTARAWLRLLMRRALRLAAAGALLLIIYNVWNIASLQSQQQLTEHTRQLTAMALDQVEHSTLRALQQNDETQLASITQHLQQQPDVISVVVRTPLGTSQMVSGEPTSVIDWPADAVEPWIMTRELQQGGQLVGYLQVILDKHQLLAASDAAHDGLMQQGRILLLLAMLAGVFIMLGFNRIRDRFWERNKLPTK